MRYGYGRRTSRTPLVVFGLVVVVGAAAGGGWWYLRARPGVRSGAAGPDQPVAAKPEAGALRGAIKPAVDAAQPKPVRSDFTLAADEQPVRPAASAPVPTQPVAARPVLRPVTQSAPAPAEPSGGLDPTAGRATSDTRTGNTTIEAARKLHASGQVLEARAQLNSLLKGRLGDAEDTEVRALLARIADETVFGSKADPNDPLVSTYVVQPGDVLIHIGRKLDVPAEVLMTINGIRDARGLRADQKIKVVRGPFHAKIYKSKFRMDVYLGDVFVRSYRVALGVENGTPEGVWRVKERLENPTYYPAPSASDKRIIAADDPNNPLGEHWIGLEGVEGEAVGHSGYGIHGTIEPESIGKAVSLGCIRMHNEDVAFVYKLMMPGKSTVTILP